MISRTRLLSSSISAGCARVTPPFLPSLSHGAAGRANRPPRERENFFAIRQIVRRERRRDDRTWPHGIAWLYGVEEERRTLPCRERGCDAAARNAVRLEL